MSAQDQLVPDFVDSAVAQRRRMDMLRWPGKVPPTMVDASVPPMDDWIGWKPIPSLVSDADLDELEAETKLSYPPLYRQFLKHQHFVNLSDFAVSFERHLPGEWKERLRRAYFDSWDPDRILEVGLIPFGSEVLMDAGPVCFDTRKRDQNGDCPVVFWDHEWIGTDREICPMFSSSQKMFECLLFATQIDLSFIHQFPDDDATTVSKKRRLLADWLSIDPLGANGPAKPYWCAFGISPDA